MAATAVAALKLEPEELTRPYSPDQFNFTSTDELEPFRGVLGQERAVEALQFGVAMPRAGYNVYVMGEPGTGRFSFVKRYLQAEAKRLATPTDWVYVNHFDDPREPRALQLPPGEGAQLIADINQLIDNLLSTFPAAFEHPTYQQKKNAIDRAFNQRYDKALDIIEKASLEKDVALYRDSANIAFTPMKDGKALDEAEFAQLPEAERERFHRDISALEEQLNEELASLPQWKRESSNQLRQLNEETITQALLPLLAPLSARYAENASVVAYLQAMQVNLLKTVVDQMVEDNRSDAQRRRALEEDYSPSLVVGHHAQGGAPVVFESHPTYDNLFGRIEYNTDQGALYTSYRQLRPGALHRANGGYLIVEADKLLSEPFVWDALKRALHSRQLKMESPLGDFGRVATVTLTPQVLPLQLKVVIVGSRELYYTLQDLDPDFQEMFRVLVDFDEEIALSDESLEQFAQLLKTRTSEEGMAPLTGAAVARLATYSARLAEHQGRLSARIGDLFTLVSVADFIRHLAGDALTFFGVQILQIGLGHGTRALFVDHLVHHGHRRLGQDGQRWHDDLEFLRTKLLERQIGLVLPGQQHIALAALHESHGRAARAGIQNRHVFEQLADEILGTGFAAIVAFTKLPGSQVVPAGTATGFGVGRDHLHIGLDQIAPVFDTLGIALFHQKHDGRGVRRAVERQALLPVSRHQVAMLVQCINIAGQCQRGHIGLDAVNDRPALLA